MIADAMSSQYQEPNNKAQKFKWSVIQLIAHGTAYLLKGRMLNCSDRSLEYVRALCHHWFVSTATITYASGRYAPERICTTCDSSKDICHTVRVINTSCMNWHSWASEWF